ncbi:tetratricopeptide repeat protein [Pedobacter cryotolerans]|uniref:Tetratricopeptide repeat protein n=1 Tax=Pedobacter cryotolerans TaxID=2571270 RepID=A0A4U1C530_9SPHI|nr:tetratricopeptide repeat protein [Pedobacter cryotolerans]TKB98410.1 tetratricopeptide repeat protein [Pedobacter cryotolerans]
MKKLLLSILIVGSATLANAQKSEVAEAKKKWGIFTITGGKGEFDKTMAALNEGLVHTDKAIANEKSSILPEAWSYRALFASSIAVTDSVNNENSIAKQKIAEEAIAKTKSIDTKETEKDNLEVARINIRNAVTGRAIRAYNKKDFKTALASFKEVIELNPTDTSMYLNAAVVARMDNNFPESITYFKKMIGFNVPDAKNYYTEIINLNLINLKDTTAALGLITEALAKYPNDGDLIAMETDIYISRGDIEKSQASLQKLIANNPKNALYQYLLGTTYFNTALEIQKQRDKLDAKKVKEYNAESAKVVAMIDQSLPYFTKALELDPNHQPSLDILTRIYAFKGDTKSYEEIKKRLDALPKKN